MAPAVFNVTNLNDAAIAPAGSLRAAVNQVRTQANDSTVHRIVISGNLNGTINLVRALPTINRNVEIIMGLGNGKVTIARPNDAETNFRIFDFSRVGGVVLVSGLTFADGRAASGAGIQATSLESLTLHWCTFHQNDANSGGGLFLGNVRNTFITHCAFINNSATLGGGGISADGGNIVIASTTFHDNTSPESGAGILAQVNNLTITGGSFTMNIAGSDGGAIWVDNVPRGELNITGTVFTQNQAEGDGGAIWNGMGRIRGTIRD